MKSKFLRLLAIGIIGAIGLSGCAESVPQPKAEKKVAEYPAVDDARFQSIMKDLGSQLEKAAKDGKADSASRLSANAKKLWNSFYKYKKAAPKIPLSVKSVTTTNTMSWPRYIIAVTGTDGDKSSGSVLTFVQKDAKSQFVLDSWVNLLPKQPFPATFKMETGAVSVPKGSTKYLVDPVTVPAEYVKLLGGQTSALKDKIADSPVTKRLQADKADLQKAIEGSGSVTFTYAMLDDQVVTMALTEAGAISVGIMKVSVELKKSGGRIVKVGGEVGDALGDSGKVTSKANWEYTIPVVFVVPKTGSKDKIRIVAADRILTAATKG